MSKMITTSNRITPPPRMTSIELLRILSMIMIIFHHFSLHGGFKWDNTTITLPRFWYNFIIMGGKIGVNIFILISGYFLINNKSLAINIKKILKLEGQILFYSISIYIIFFFNNMSQLNMKSLITTCFPITFSSWWFASSYFVLFLIHPFLNRLLYNINKTMYQNLLLLLVVCWSIIPTFTTSSYQSNNLLWFITLYSIAGYARLYGFNPKFTAKHYFISFFVCSALTYFSSVLLMFLDAKISIFPIYTTYFYGPQTITILLISLSLFMAFVNLKINYHKWINIMASAAFGVYLIHDNNLVRPFLWLNVFKNAQYQNSIMLIPYSILVVFIVYIVCTLIDLLRIQFIEKPYMKLVDILGDTLLVPVKAICRFFKNAIFGT